jgi:hypothetical protein
MDKCRHAWAVLTYLRNTDKTPTADILRKEFTAAQETRRWIKRQIHETRAKDFKSHFKKMTFRNKDEMDQVLGKNGDSSFVRHVQKKNIEFKALIERVNARLI